MTHRNEKKFARTMTLMLCMGMLAGVLIWAKLRLVTDIPRSAYAEPKDAESGQVDPADQSAVVEDAKSRDELSPESP